jgi:hypothetical protein
MFSMTLGFDGKNYIFPAANSRLRTVLPPQPGALPPPFEMDIQLSTIARAAALSDVPSSGSVF